MTNVYPVKNGPCVNQTNRCPFASDVCIRENGQGAYGSDPLWLEREPTERPEVLLAVALRVRAFIK